MGGSVDMVIEEHCLFKNPRIHWATYVLPREAATRNMNISEAISS